MSKPEIFKSPIPPETVRRLADESFQDMVKFVVDLDREMICAGGGLHADEEALLIENGSKQSALWGGNYYLDEPAGKRLEYSSMINIRPADGNAQQTIASEKIRGQVLEMALHYFESKP